MYNLQNLYEVGMYKELIYNEEEFNDFCDRMRIGKYIRGFPCDYPCVIVYAEEIYEFVYMGDFDI